MAKLRLAIFYFYTKILVSKTIFLIKILVSKPVIKKLKCAVGTYCFVGLKMLKKV